MASSPAKRQRRGAAVKRVRDGVPIPKVAEAFGVHRSTLHRWVEAAEKHEAERAKARPARHSARRSSPPAGPFDAMRAALQAAQRVEAQAVEETERQLEAGNASEARNAAAAGGIWSDKALALAKALAAAEGEREAEQVRLREGTIALQAELLRCLFEALDLPVPVRMLRALALAASRGEPLVVPAELTAEERARVRSVIEAEVSTRLLADVSSPSTQPDDAESVAPAPQAVEMAAVPDEPAIEEQPTTQAFARDREDGFEPLYAEGAFLREGHSRGGGLRRRHDLSHPGTW